jgi:hypothetical protein
MQKRDLTANIGNLYLNVLAIVSPMLTMQTMKRGIPKIEYTMVAI